MNCLNFSHLVLLALIPSFILSMANLWWNLNFELVLGNLFVLGLVGLIGLQDALGVDDSSRHPSPRDPHVYENNGYQPGREGKTRLRQFTPTPATHSLTPQTQATITKINGHTTSKLPRQQRNRPYSEPNFSVGNLSTNGMQRWVTRIFGGQTLNDANSSET